VNIAWALLSLKRRYRGGVTLVVALRAGEREFELVFTPSYLAVTEGRAARPELRVTGSLQAVRAWSFERVDASALREQGELTVDGPETAWDAFRSAFAEREPSAEDVAERLALGGVFSAEA